MQVQPYLPPVDPWIGHNASIGALHADGATYWSALWLMEGGSVDLVGCGLLIHCSDHTSTLCHLQYL